MTLGHVGHYTVVIERELDGSRTTVGLMTPGNVAPVVRLSIPELAAVLAMAQTAQKEETEARLLKEHLSR